jgi:hypothetical protein
LNRREFLKSLLAIGVSVAVPYDLASAAAKPTFNIDNASDAEIDTILDNGICGFEVNDYGTISFADFVEPTTRAEAYGYSVDELQDIRSLVSFAESNPLSSRLQYIYEWALEAEPDGPDYGWVTWLEESPDEARPLIYAEVEEYLAEAPDYNDYDFLPDNTNAQGAAYKFFQTEDWDELEQLGIVIVEGECPGSSYYAAELRNTVEDANRIAADLGVWYRFKVEGA